MIRFRTGRHTLTFKYIKDKHKERLVPRPRVEIRLSNGDKTFKFAMLVDSGADVSFIPLEVAEILGLKLEDKQKSSSASGEFETFRSTVSADLLKGTTTYPLGNMDIRVPCKSTESANLNAHALLGRSLFFKRFDITFRETIFKIVLRPPKNK